MTHEKYSEGWLREELKGLDFIPIRRCSLCGTQLGYVVVGDALAFDTNCACVTYTTTPRPATWQDLASTLRVQANDTIRDNLVATMKGQARPRPDDRP